ncbi:flavodoxin family protein [Lacrimispora sp. JR3]|uniref:flavodoxin family protein n=1 Tax=Lacrimispora sinapis TaxID=3111456 RepID=UPI0037479388
MIYPPVNNADIMILTTPVYVFNMSAQLKVFLDRLHAVDYRVFKGKKIVLLTTYGDNEEEHSGVQNVIKSIRMTAQMLEMDLVQTLNISTYSAPITKNEKAYILGKNLVNKEQGE